MPLTQLYRNEEAGNVQEIAAFNESTTYTVTGSGSDQEIHTYSFLKSMFKNRSYVASAMIFSFTYSSNGTTSNDFWVTLDGTRFFTFPNHNTTATNYKVFIPISNINIDHTVGIYTNDTVGCTINLLNAEFSIIATVN